MSVGPRDRLAEHVTGGQASIINMHFEYDVQASCAHIETAIHRHVELEFERHLKVRSTLSHPCDDRIVSIHGKVT